MFTVQEIKDHLTGMGHGGTLNKVRNIEQVFERAASVFLQKCKPVETMRTASLASTVYDDIYNYALPSDYNSLIDLIPQDDREKWDMAYRRLAGEFDLHKAIRQKTISVEGSEGSKIIRINWRTRSPKVLHSMNSLTDNGTWAVVAGASGLVLDEITKRTGSGSIRFDVATTGDGISNTGMSAVDLTDEDEVGDVFLDLYLKNATDVANFNSITGVWGNDITTAYWTGVAQTTRADGTALRAGWNEIKIPWSTATETGTVAPATIDSFKLTLNVDAAISDVRVDNIRFAIGRSFEMKYYSKYLFKNSAGTYLSKPASDDDNVTIDNDALPIFLYEVLKIMAHQMEGTDSAFDISFAENELRTLYPAFRSEHPDQRKKAVARYTSGPRLRR